VGKQKYLKNKTASRIRRRPLYYQWSNANRNFTQRKSL